MDGKSARTLAGELTARVTGVGADTVHKLLREQGFSLQANAKTIEGKQHPDRDGQFRYINEQARAHLAAGDPVISVDAKKKEQVGQYASPGRTWRPKGDPVRVRDHDFPGRWGEGDPVRDLRPGRQRRLGERRHRPRHRRVRDRVDPPLVERPRAATTTRPRGGC